MVTRVPELKKITLLLFIIFAGNAYSQVFTVFDIDTTDYPVMKAKFYAFDEDGNQIRNLFPDDFEVFENGTKREVLSISCPEPKPSQAISSVLTIDVSGSMTGQSLINAQSAARAWVNGLPLGKSECAITTFNLGNYFNQDFTTDRNKLINAINNLSAGGGTSFDAGFINIMAGGLIAAEKGKYKRIIVFLTDGYASGNETEIIQKANQLNTTVYCITLNHSCPDMLKNIANKTGGEWFENITTLEQAKEIYKKLLLVVQLDNPCEIKWETIQCHNNAINLEIISNPISISSNAIYFLPINKYADIQYKPNSVYFINPVPGIKIDTTITVKAINDDFIVYDIQCSNPNFSITPKSFTIKKGESRKLTLSYLPIDSNYAYAEIEFINNLCHEYFYTGSVFLGTGQAGIGLKLTHPNGGEVFTIGSDTVITWENISPEERVLIEYSNDSGQSWELIENDATGLKYEWKNVPKPTSDDCLVRIKQLVYDNKIEVPKIQWKKTYGGKANDIAQSIIQTIDGGYAIAGWSASSDGDITGFKGGTAFWIVKIDSIGNIQWEKLIGGYNGKENAYSIKQTWDGGYIIAGSSETSNGDVSENKGEEDFWIVKLDINGNLIWEKSYGGSSKDIASSIELTNDYGYIIAGTSYSHDGDRQSSYIYGSDIWIIKVDYLGNIQWEKSFGGSYHDEAFSIQKTIDGGYIVAGYTSSTDGDIKDKNDSSNDYWIVKLDYYGNIQWQKTYGGSYLERAQSVYQTYDAGYIVSGYTRSDDGDVSGYKGTPAYGYDFWIVKLDMLGDLQWEKSLGGSEKDYGYSIKQTIDGGYIVVGGSNSIDGDISGTNINSDNTDVWIAKIDNDGNIQWDKLLGGSRSDCAYSVEQSFDGSFIIAGITESWDGDIESNHGSSDYWVIKLSPDCKNIQQDISDSFFSIISSQPASKDIDMGKVIFGESKDSVVNEFILNTGTWKYRVDSIYFTGADASAFGMVSGFPEYEVDAGGSYFGEFRFTPSRVGSHQAEIVIITQADTLIQNIYGEGVERKLEIYSDIINFGIIEIFGDTTISRQLITNISTDSIAIDSTEMLGPDREQFNIITGGGNFVLAPDESRELEIMFKPKYIGRTSGQIGFYYNDIGSPAAAQLYGAGIGGGLCVSYDSAFAGQKRMIKVNLDGGELPKFSEIVKSFNCKLRFEKSILAPRDAGIIYKQTDDSTYIELTGNIIKGNDCIAETEFICGLGKVQETTIDIEEITWFDESGNPIEYDSECQSGVFKLLGICNEGGRRLINPESTTGIISIKPNPAENELNIEFSVIEEGYTEISIFNVIGEKVKTVFAKDISSFGKKNIQTDISGLGSGQYMIIFKSPTWVESKQILIVK